MPLDLRIAGKESAEEKSVGPARPLTFPSRSMPFDRICLLKKSFLQSPPHSYLVLQSSSD